MLNCLNIPLLLLLAFVSSSLFAQLDPDLIDSLSKLPVEQRERLIKHGNQQPHSNSDKSNSSNLIPSTESYLEEMKSHDSLEDLIEFEMMISSKVHVNSQHQSDDFFQLEHDSEYVLGQCFHLVMSWIFAPGPKMLEHVVKPLFRLIR